VDTFLAVRSSATAEDGGDASFAGQYATVLGVRGEAAVGEAVVACWRSFFSANALVERARHGLLGEQEAMAVLIQPVVAAECAGVCFSVDPVQQQRDLIVVNAAWGLGPGVVDGIVAADSYWVRRQDFSVEKRHIVEKTAQIALDPAGGLQQIALAAERSRAACLPEAWLERVAQFGVAAELVFGRPQDVEWAIASEQVWILQSRPLTALLAELAHGPFPINWESDDDRRYFWSLWLLLPHETLWPLEHDYLALLSRAEGEKRRRGGGDLIGRAWVCNGRVYRGLIPSDVPPAERQQRRSDQADLEARLYAQGMTLWEYWKPGIISATERLRAFDAGNATGSQLAEHVEDALAVFHEHSILHGLVWTSLKPFHAVYGRVADVSEAEAKTAADKLLVGEETALTRFIDGLYDLAVTARPIPGIASLVSQPPADILMRLGTMPEATAFLTRLDRFLNLYGERTGHGFGSEGTICMPTLREEPVLMMKLIAQYLDPAVAPPAQARQQVRAARDAEVEALCAACSDDEAVAEFRRQWVLARKEATVLEEHNYYIDQMAIGQLRQAALGAARWLVDRDVLQRPDDVFWLHFDEILAMLRAETPGSLAEKIAARQAQQAAWARLEPPPILGVPAADLPERPPLGDEVTGEADGKEGRLAGLGASPGRYQGRARVVARGVTLPELAPGDVLVAENAGPLWTPFFPLLGALVLETGALGQHAAATAREYGIPAVIGAKNAMRFIADGDTVIVNGTAGTVEHLPAA
jgi:pyruvate,water dikinase